MATATGGMDHGSRFRALGDISQFPENKPKKKRLSDQIDPKTGFKLTDKLLAEYYILERIEGDFEKVSPFFIEKALTTTIGSNHITKLLRNGTLLIKCKNDKQAECLLKFNTFLFGNSFKVKVSEHSSLNTVQGLIYCKASRYLTEDEITEGLADEKVVAVRKIKRKVGDNLVDTNLCILTFKKSTLPSSIKFGYHSVLVEVYIPSPLRCLNCFRFGHTRKYCKSDRICASCSDKFHDPSACSTGSRCINCKGDHSNWSKDCPQFKREVSIQTIKVQEKISYFEAKKKFDSFDNTANSNTVYSQNTLSYSQVLNATQARAAASAHTHLQSSSLMRTTAQSNTQSSSHMRTSPNDQSISTHTSKQLDTNAFTNTEKANNYSSQSSTEITHTLTKPSFNHSDQSSIYTLPASYNTEKTKEHSNDFLKQNSDPIIINETQNISSVTQNTSNKKKSLSLSLSSKNVKSKSDVEALDPEMSS